MNIILPIHKKYTDIILSNKKPFEFRNKIGKNVNIGDKVYIYETGHQKGCKKIVGEFTIKDILNISNPNKGWIYGGYWFIDYFCKYVLKNETYANLFKIAKETNLPNYKLGSTLDFALDENYMEYIKMYAKWPPLAIGDYKKQDEARKVMNQLDDWLFEIGYYNTYGESFYKYALQIGSTIIYDNPKELCEFINLKREPIKTAPQNFFYTLS